MATKTAPMPTASTLIPELMQVREQIAATKAQGGEARAHRRALETMANKLGDLKDVLENAGASGDIDKVVDSLNEWADVIAPNAEVSWNREEVDAKLQLLDALATLNQLTDAEKETVAELKVDLKASRGGTGQRAPRTPQPRLEGRPEKVAVSGPDGVFSTQAGNVENSASNLKEAAVRFIRKATGEDVSVEDQKALLAAAKEVAEGRVEQDEFSGIIFSVA